MNRECHIEEVNTIFANKITCVICVHQADLFRVDIKVIKSCSQANAKKTAISSPRLCHTSTSPSAARAAQKTKMASAGEKQKGHATGMKGNTTCVLVF